MSRVSGLDKNASTILIYCTAKLSTSDGGHSKRLLDVIVHQRSLHSRSRGSAATCKSPRKTTRITIRYAVADPRVHGEGPTSSCPFGKIFRESVGVRA